MATTIKTAFESLYLTAHLPEEVSIVTDANSVEVKVLLENKNIFSSVYYTYQNTIIVRDIRSVIEAAMLDSGMRTATMKMTVTAAENVVSTGNIIVVFCAFKSTDSSETFLKTHFLTTRKSALVPRSGSFTLSNYSEAYVQGNNTATVFYRTLHDNSRHVYSYSLGRVQTTTEGIVTADLSHQHFKEVVERNISPLTCIVEGVEYQIGNRHFNIFFTDEAPTDIFTLRSAFNIMETAYLYGATTIKTEVDRSEAVCGQATHFYDETVKVKHEVETAPLPYDEAKWINQLLTSKLVRRPIDNETMPQVLISDITSEVTDSDKDVIRLKFSWKYADGNEYI